MALFWGRLGSLNALRMSGASRFWKLWLGHPMPSAETMGNVHAKMDADMVREAIHQVYSGPRRQFGEHFEIRRIEGVDALDVIGLHSCHKLQIEHIASGHGMTLQQGHPARHRPGRCGQQTYARKREQRRNGVDRLGRGKGAAIRRGLVTME